VKHRPPSHLKLKDEVFHCKLTNEIFTDYDQFFERIILCNSVLWTCSLTGRSNLTYQEALDSERRARKRRARKRLQAFPDNLQKAVLYIASLTPRTHPTFQLPQEIWTIIFSSLSGRDLQTASDVCKNFRDILLPTLWHEPRFKKNSISMKELQEIAVSNLPIRVLRLSQFKIDYDDTKVPEIVIESQFKRLIKILKSFELVSFILDECDKSLCGLTQKQLRLLCQLPITHFNTRSFHPDIIHTLYSC